MNIEQIAQEITADLGYTGGQDEVLSVLKLGLSKLAEQDMEPVGWLCNGELYEVRQYRLFPRDEPIQGQEKLYTETQLLAAQQRTAEACAKAVERLISGDGICADNEVWIHDCADAIRRGDWREYL